MASSTHYQGVQKDSAGFKLLKSMGWSEGEGLGANKQGLKEHIRVKKKFENWGVGAVESHNRTSNWSNGMNEFHRVLSSLSEITSKHANGSSASDDDQESVEVGEKQEAGARDGKKGRKDRDKDSKKKKTRNADAKKEKKRKRGDPPAKEERCPEEDAPEEKIEKKRATHIGRFKRRETSKMVKGYSSSDLAAILGEDPFAKQAASMAAIENTPVQVESSSDADDDDGNNDDQTRKKDLTTTPNKVEKIVKDTTVQVDAWWSGYFMIGPRAGSRSEKIAIRQRQKKVGFSEADQEALDAWAHSHATQGKVGLGRSSLKKTIGGAKWEGKKTKLGSDSEDEEVDVDDVAVEEEEDDNCIQVVMPKKDTAAGAIDEDAAIQRVRELLGKEKKKELKVKALAKAVDIPKLELVEKLQARPGSFKLSKSKSRVSLSCGK